MKSTSVRPTKKKSNEEDIDCIYEYIVQYIQSPVFRTPIRDYIDTNCIFFESNDSENSFEHTKLHNVNHLII